MKLLKKNQYQYKYYDEADNDVLTFFEEETAISVVEIVLIIVVLIGMVIIFQKNLKTFVESIFGKITEKGGQIE